MPHGVTTIDFPNSAEDVRSFVSVPAITANDIVQCWFVEDATADNDEEAHALAARFVAATIGRKPFFFAWSPTDYPYEVAYCWHAREPVPLTSPVTGRKSVTLDLKAIADDLDA